MFCTWSQDTVLSESCKGQKWRRKWPGLHLVIKWAVGLRWIPGRHCKDRSLEACCCHKWWTDTVQLAVTSRQAHLLPSTCPCMASMLASASLLSRNETKP